MPIYYMHEYLIGGRPDVIPRPVRVTGVTLVHAADAGGDLKAQNGDNHVQLLSVANLETERIGEGAQRQIFGKDRAMIFLSFSSRAT